MSDDLLAEQFARLLDSLPAGDPWPALEESGFLDLLAEASLEEVFPLALVVGAKAQAPDVLDVMARRLADPVPRALAATLAAGEMAGALQAVQALTADYALTRKQFGREIGKFQAIQHQIAVMAEEVMAARMAAQAAFVGAPSEVSERRAAAAKIRCNQAAARVSAIAHAVHGAIGVSDEFVLHHHTRRLRALSLAHGGESWWAAQLGDWALSEAQDFTALARAL
jgi:acyl-CoA dehydrogenase